jgi:hypothetical protein
MRVTTLLSPHRTSVVNKTLLYPLLALCLIFNALPGVSRAADGGDYLSVRVPDVTQAVSFFRDAMNCSEIGAGSSTSAADASALMSCGRETTVEIRRSTVAVPPQNAPAAASASQPLTLDTDDATRVAAWLRNHHVRLIGSPTRLTRGADAGKVAVSFLTPWGEPLRLISRINADDLLPSAVPATQVAAQ